MKIFTEEIRKYSKLIMSTINIGSSYGEYCYINFTESRIQIDSINRFYGRVTFRCEDTDPGDADIENFYVDTRGFLALCKQYEDGIYLRKTNGKDQVEFYVDDEKFKIPILNDEYDDSLHSYSNKSLCQLSVDTVKKIKEASKFVGINDGERNLDGIGFNQNVLVAASGAKMYVATINETVPKFSLSTDIVNVLTMVADDHPIDLDFESNDDEDDEEETLKVFFNIGFGEAEIVAPHNLSVAVPDLINDTDFIDGLNIPTTAVVEKVELINILRFFESFVRLEVNQSLTLNVVDEDTLAIESSRGMTGNRMLSLKECDIDLVGTQFFFSRNILLPALSVIHDDFIRIKIDPDEDSPVFIITGEKEDSTYAAIAKFEGANE